MRKVYLKHIKNTKVKKFILVIFCFTLLLTASYYFTQKRIAKSPKLSDFTELEKKNTQIDGIIKSGEDLNISYCKEGLYIETNDSKKILIKMADINNSSQMYTNLDAKNRLVSIDAIYPVQTEFCDALICECEDYLLAKIISFK